MDESPLLARRCQNVIEERGGGNSPLAVCRRLAGSDEPGDHEALAARCGELLDEGVKNPRELCTSLDRESVEAHPDLAQRCRNFIGDKRDSSGGGENTAIAICRTLTESDDAGEHATLATRCGELLDEGVKNPRELCTSLDRESVEAHRDLAQRCRNFIGDKRDSSGGGGNTAIAICRTLAESDDAGEHATLATRCSELLDDGVKSAHELCTSLDRESVEAHADLAQRCRNFINDRRGGEDTGTDGDNLRPERGNTGNGGLQLGGRPSPTPRRGNQ